MLNYGLFFISNMANICRFWHFYTISTIRKTSVRVGRTWNCRRVFLARQPFPETRWASGKFTWGNLVFGFSLNCRRRLPVTALMYKLKEGTKQLHGSRRQCGCCYNTHFPFAQPCFQVLTRLHGLLLARLVRILRQNDQYFHSHKERIIRRDFTAVNVLMTKKGSLCPADLSLIWSPFDLKPFLTPLICLCCAQFEDTAVVLALTKKEQCVFSDLLWEKRWQRLL